MSAPPPLLSVENLSVEIAAAAGRAQVLDRIGFTLERGQRLGLVGESGCGKSMTALAIMGLLPDAAEATGRIVLAGQNMIGADDTTLCRVRGRRVSMVFQEPMTALNPVKPIGVQVAEGPRLHFGLGRAEAEARAVRMLDRVGLPPGRFSPNLYPHQLSGGQRQRVVIAMALVCEPDILIADEPTTALDVTIQAQILDLINTLTDEQGLALIMITHDLGVVAEMTERIVVMYAGSIVESGPTEAVFRRMSHPYTRGLFAAIPGAAPVIAQTLEIAQVPGKRPRLAAIPGQVPDPSALPPGCAFAERCAAATEDCHTQQPPITEIGPAHTATCFHATDPYPRDPSRVAS